MKKPLYVFLIFAFAACSALLFSSCGGGGNDEGAHTHTLIYNEPTEASCSREGSVGYYFCADCDKKYSDADGKSEILDVVIPKAHTGGGEIRNAKAPTEDSEGYTGDTYCLGCGELVISGKTLPRLDHAHSIIKIPAKAPDCKNDGNIEYYACSVCAKKYYDEDGKNEITDITIPKAHVGGIELYNVKAPSEYSEGYTGDVCCAGCGYMLAVGSPIPKLDHIHSMIKIEAKAPSCKSDGNIEYYTCTVCEKYYADSDGTNEISDISIPRLHTGGTEIRNQKSATEDSEGYTGDIYCLGCGDMLIVGERVERLPHTHVISKTEAVAPGCTSEGNVEYYICNTCQKIYADEGLLHEILYSDTVIEAVGHSVTHREAKAADCFSDGNIEYWHCSVCKNSYTDSSAATMVDSVVISRLEHKFIYYEAIAETCTQNGRQEHYFCSLCKRSYSDESALEELFDPVIPAAHRLTYKAAIPASCTKSGNIEYWHCEVCGNDYIDEAALALADNVITEMTDHVFSGGLCLGCGLREAAELIYKLEGVEYSVVGIDEGEASNVIIPAYYNGLPVTSIAEGAFSANDRLINVSIGDCVQNIGDYAFSDCVNLRSVTFGSLTRYIGDYAFSGCKRLCGIVFPEGLYSIGESCFRSCISLTDIILPQGVTIIGANAFYSCIGVVSVTLPRSVEMILSGTFYGCDKLVEVINNSTIALLPSIAEHGNVAYYAKEVHNGESKIVRLDGFIFYTYEGTNYLLGYEGDQTVITLPDSYNGEAYKIYKSAFLKHPTLTEITVPDGVTAIGASAFKESESLTKVSLGEGIEKISSSSFRGCVSLEEIVIPDSVKTVENYAFYDCRSLSTVTLGKGLTGIYAYAFDKCNSLELVINKSSLNVTAGSKSNGYVAYYAKEVRREE